VAQRMDRSSQEDPDVRVPDAEAVG
jgi:hypothetical protein